MALRSATFAALFMCIGFGCNAIAQDTALLKEYTLPGCSDEIDHAVANFRDAAGDIVIFKKIMASTPIGPNERKISDVEENLLKLSDAQTRSGESLVIAFTQCGGTSSCSTKTCQGKTSVCVNKTNGCGCQ